MEGDGLTMKKDPTLIGPIGEGPQRIAKNPDGTFQTYTKEELPAGGRGLSAREYFTAQAMAAVLAGRLTPIEKWDPDNVAKMAVSFADATLRHLEKTRPKD